MLTEKGEGLNQITVTVLDTELISASVYFPVKSPALLSNLEEVTWSMKRHNQTLPTNHNAGISFTLKSYSAVIFDYNVFLFDTEWSHL